MRTIAIPIFGSRISPRLDLANNFEIIKIDNNKIVETENIKLVSHNRLEKINMIIELKPDVIICDGLSEICKQEIDKSNIKLIPWIHGEVKNIVKMYLNNQLNNPVDKK